MQWILTEHGKDNLNYLDDFLFFGKLDEMECDIMVGEITALLKNVGVPMMVHKTDEPARKITFLGIEIEGEMGVIRLPERKQAAETLRTPTKIVDSLLASKHKGNMM